MKKLLSLLMAAIMCLSIVACGENGKTGDKLAGDPDEVGLTNEQQLIVEGVNAKLSAEEFAGWQSLYREFTGEEPKSPEIANITHYQIDDFDGEKVDCYLINISADVAYWIDEGAEQGSIESNLYLIIDGKTETVYDNIATDALNAQHDTTTDYGRATYLLWIYANSQSGAYSGNYLNDSETVTELSSEDVQAINRLCVGENPEGNRDADEKETAETTKITEATEEQESASDIVEAIVSDEEFMGIYQSAVDERRFFIFKQDKILRSRSRSESDSQDFWEVSGWKISGNTLIVSESTGMGDAVFEIVKDGDTILLKFIEISGGDGGLLGANPEFLSDLTKVASGKETTIELSLENWQDYLEIRPATNGPLYNNFNEFQRLDYVNWAMFLKEDIADSVAKMNDVAIEYSFRDGYFSWFEYNLDTGEFVKKEAASEGEVDSWLKVEDSNRDLPVTLASVKEDGCFLVFISRHLSDSVNNNIYSFIGEAYGTMEITRIKGSITIVE